jgi:hypothetical protein
MPIVGVVRRVELLGVKHADGSAVVGSVTAELRVRDPEGTTTYETAVEGAPDADGGRNWHFDVTLDKPLRWHFTYELSGAIVLIEQSFVDVDYPYVKDNP